MHSCHFLTKSLQHKLSLLISWFFAVWTVEALYGTANYTMTAWPPRLLNPLTIATAYQKAAVDCTPQSCGLTLHGPQETMSLLRHWTVSWSGVMMSWSLYRPLSILRCWLAQQRLVELEATAWTLKWKKYIKNFCRLSSHFSRCHM